MGCESTAGSTEETRLRTDVGGAGVLDCVLRGGLAVDRVRLQVSPPLRVTDGWKVHHCCVESVGKGIRSPSAARIAAWAPRSGRIQDLRCKPFHMGLCRRRGSHECERQAEKVSGGVSMFGAKVSFFLVRREGGLEMNRSRRQGNRGALGSVPVARHPGRIGVRRTPFATGLEWLGVRTVSSGPEVGFKMWQGITIALPHVPAIPGYQMKAHAGKG